MAGETNMSVVGNLVSDPELRYTQNGVAVANFTIASKPSVFDKTSGTYKDGEPLFLRSVAWKTLAEHVAGSLTKGSRVVASGRLRQKSYVTKEGENRTAFELEIDDIGASMRFSKVTVQDAVPSGRDFVGSLVDANRVSGTNTSSNNSGSSTGQESNTSSDLWASDETPF